MARDTLRATMVAWRWTLAALVAFGVWAGGYMAVGWWTAMRPLHSVWTPVDALVPLVPEFVFFYLGVYPMVLLPFFLAQDDRHFWPFIRAYGIVLGVCYGLFLVYPVGLAHPVVPVRDFATWVLQLVYAGDPPSNCFPSTHCAMSLVAALCLYRVDRRFGWWAFGVAFTIGISTLFTEQHYALDVVAGWVVALGAADVAWDGPVRRFVRRRRAGAAG